MLRFLQVALYLFAAARSAAANLVEWPITLTPQSTADGIHASNDKGPELLDPPYHSAGYLDIDGTEDSKLFYFYFQERSRSPDAPLVFWTNGGPGCSSLFGLFYENGPYEVDVDTGALKWSQYGWDIGQNVLFVEQPVGVGFSGTGDERDLRHFEKGVAEDMLNFFWSFMELHPEMKDKELYLSGESYAGHYLPAIAKRIYDANEEKVEGKPYLNLKGIILGNPWTEPATQEISQVEFARQHGLLSNWYANYLMSYKDECLEKAAKCNEKRLNHECDDARQFCSWFFWRPIQTANPNINVYDIRKKCYVPGCYDISHITRFLNNPEIQKQLGVHKEWEDCSDKVWVEMKEDIYISMKSTVKFLIEEAKLRIIIYVGDQDLICNFVGNDWWIKSMELEGWTGEMKPWELDGKGVGTCETVEPFTFCKVFGAGHMVPHDKPEVALDMVHRFIAGEPFVSSKRNLRAEKVSIT